MWAEKKVSCKKCVCTYAVRCLPTQIQITLEMRTVSLITRILHWLGERVTTKDAALKSNTVAAAALGESIFNSLLRARRGHNMCTGGVYGFSVPCCGPESTPNGELPEDRRRTHDTYGAKWSRSLLQVLKF